MAGDRRRRGSFGRMGSLQSSLEFYGHEEVGQDEVDNLFMFRKALDKSEIRAFLSGRIKLEDRLVQLMFKKYDHNRDRLIEKEEFEAMVVDINSCLAAFDEQDRRFHVTHMQTVYNSLAFMYGCFLCTAGLSCWLGSQRLDEGSVEYEARASTEKKRFNVFLKDMLLKDVDGHVNIDCNYSVDSASDDTRGDTSASQTTRKESARGVLKPHQESTSTEDSVVTV